MFSAFGATLIGTVKVDKFTDLAVVDRDKAVSLWKSPQFSYYGKIRTEDVIV
jgi:hypothetical protein